MSLCLSVFCCPLVPLTWLPFGYGLSTFNSNLDNWARFLFYSRFFLYPKDLSLGPHNYHLLMASGYSVSILDDTLYSHCTLLPGSLLRKKEIWQAVAWEHRLCWLKKFLLALKVSKNMLMKVNMMPLKQDGIEIQTEMYWQIISAFYYSWGYEISETQSIHQ